MLAYKVKVPRFYIILKANWPCNMANWQSASSLKDILARTMSHDCLRQFFDVAQPNYKSDNTLLSVKNFQRQTRISNGQRSKAIELSTQLLI